MQKNIEQIRVHKQRSIAFANTCAPAFATIHTAEHASVRESGAVCTNHLSNHHARQLNDAVT